MMPATKMATIQQRRLNSRNMTSVTKKLAMQKRQTVGRSRLLDLPPELRNKIYASLYAPKTRFETSQRITDRDVRRLSNHYNSNAPLRHPVVIDGVQVKYLIGILGACKQTRQEATGFLNDNLRGTFTVMLQTNFQRVPKVILNLVDTLAFGPSVVTVNLKRYAARFANLKQVLAGTFVVSKQKLIKDLIDPQSSADEATHQDLIRNYFENSGISQPISRNPIFRKAHEVGYRSRLIHTGLFSGEFPVPIVIQMYVLDSDATDLAIPHEGFVVILGYTHKRVVSIEEKRFARLWDLNVPDPAQRVWHCPNAWMVLEQWQTQRPATWVSIANLEPPPEGVSCIQFI